MIFKIAGFTLLFKVCQQKNAPVQTDRRFLMFPRKPKGVQGKMTFNNRNRLGSLRV